MEPTHNTTAHTVLSYIALLSLFGMVGFVFGALNTDDAFADIDDVQIASAIAAPLLQPDFSNTQLSAESAIVFDASTNELLYTHNERAQLPLASLTKVMLALLAHEHLDPAATTLISATALIPEGESGFIAGERWVTRDLIDFTLMTSSNDGAAALAEAIEAHTGEDIATLMNARAEALGLSQTYFINETGLDSSALFSGAYGSAFDMARLFAHVYTTDAELLAATAVDTLTFTNTAGVTYEARNTNNITRALPGLVFGKTGFTDLAGGNLGVLLEVEPGHPVIVIVLGSTVTERFTDVQTLTDTVVRASQP